MRQRIEQVGAAFVTGYHAALEKTDVGELEIGLNSVPLECRGFAFEGAAMALGLMDWLTPWRRTRIQGFLSGPGKHHAYMVHVALGWVWARVPVGVERVRARLDPLLGWLAVDGWGFHEGFFHWPKYISGQPGPRRLKGYSRRVFDQGLGRSFWFVNGGNVELIGSTIASFAENRRPDLWSGIGLAATYAGEVSVASLRALGVLAGRHQSHLAQGSAFAAKARQRAGNLTDYTTLATETLCGIPAEDAARLTDATLENLSATRGEPAFEVWRQRIQVHFQQHPQRLDALANLR